MNFRYIYEFLNGSQDGLCKEINRISSQIYVRETKEIYECIEQIQIGYGCYKRLMKFVGYLKT